LKSVWSSKAEINNGNHHNHPAGIIRRPAALVY